MKRGIWLLIGAFLLATGILAAGTWHCLGWMTQRQMNQGNLMASSTWTKMLNLTTDQRSKIQPLETSLRKEMALMQTELAMHEMTLCRLTMGSAPLDRKAISKELGTLTDLQRRKEERVIDHLAALRGILTPGQQKTLFMTLMTDICRGCRQATGSRKDYCGLCNMR